MYFGKDNPRKEYVIEEGGKRIVLEATEVERDLGIKISANGKFSEQVEAAVNKASWTLGRIRITFRYFNMNRCKKLYPTFVRPLLRVFFTGMEHFIV